MTVNAPDLPPWQKIFASRTEAETYLAAHGFSVGRMQGPSPRGILFGEWDIQKWRNLRPADKAALHGVMTRHHMDAGTDGVAITIYASAPVEARAAIRSEVSAAPSSIDADQSY